MPRHHNQYEFTLLLLFLLMTSLMSLLPLKSVSSFSITPITPTTLTTPAKLPGINTIQSSTSRLRTGIHQYQQQQRQQQQEKHFFSRFRSSNTKIYSSSDTNNANANNASTTNTDTKEKNEISFDTIQNKRILVVGGSGRVGGSVVCQLLQHGARVTVGGTRVESYLASKSRWEALFSSNDNGSSSSSSSASNIKIPKSTWENEDSLSFVQIDREDAQSIKNVLVGGGKNNDDDNKQQYQYDMVVHTAGPFQGKVNSPNGVIEAAIDSGISYIDVCDDYCTATAAKTKYQQSAVSNGVACIVSTGCWPGVSSLMAKQLTDSVLKENPHLEARDLTVDFSFFTAGSGGAGSTLLVATFLILAEKSLMVVDGRRREVDAMKEYSKINFGPIVGDKDVAHLNLLEAASVHDVLGIGNVKTLFGTAPGFWNALLGAMAQLPSSLLSNEPIMEKLALFSLPIVRVVDYFAGATNAMRCDVSCNKDPSVSEMALYAHENLEPCVGECVVGFCAAVLSNCVDSGIHFPEEAIEGGEDLAQVLRLTSVGAHTLEVESNSGLTKKAMWGI